jgi:hypothetical protein
MTETIWGIVKNGMVVPQTPLPEGAPVQILLVEAPVDIPRELQEELDAWSRARGAALDLVERLAFDGEANAQG